MAEYIERESLMQKVSRMIDYCEKDNKVNVLTALFQVGDAIMDCKSEDVAPVVHGRWIDAYPDIDPNPMFMYGICSECGFEQGISKYLNYCPNCGCRMDGGDDE